MANEPITFKEAVELFVLCTVPDIQNRLEVPSLNFVFPEKAYELLYYIKDHPFTKDGYYKPNISDKDIERIKRYDSRIPSIYIKQPVTFFELLRDITNNWIKQKNKYGCITSGRSLFIRGIRRIWLRMNSEDFTNIENFLKIQLDFLESEYFDEYIDFETQVDYYEGYTIKVKKEECETWCETDNKISFTLCDESRPEATHTLPSIYYGIRTENSEPVCYIYAIQNPHQKDEDKKISRALYKLNKGIENPNVHPSAVLALKTFIDMLRAQGINKIKVPLIQVLSYEYHEMLSDITKRQFDRKWEHFTIKEILRQNREVEYERDATWLNHVYKKEPFISETKTEGLLNVFYRVARQFPNIEILTEPFVQDEYLNISINPSYKKNKTI